MSIKSAVAGALGLLLLTGLVRPIEAKQAPLDLGACMAGKGEAGVKACTEIINSHPPKGILADAYFHRGNRESELNNDNAAFADLSEAVRLVPEHHYALHNRAMLFDKRGDYAHAIGDFTRAISVEPIGGHFYNRARAYFHNGQFRRAADDYTVAVALWSDPPLNGYALAARCRVLAARNLYLADAREDCGKALASSPKNPGFLTIRALLMIRQRAFDAALSDLGKALSSTPFGWKGDDETPMLDITEVDAMFLHGVAACHLGKFAECTRDIAAASQRSASISAEYARIGISADNK